MGPREGVRGVYPWIHWGSPLLNYVDICVNKEGTASSSSYITLCISLTRTALGIPILPLAALYSKV